jgi:hypothetical protein
MFKCTLRDKFGLFYKPNHMVSHTHVGCEGKVDGWMEEGSMFLCEEYTKTNIFSLFFFILS